MNRLGERLIAFTMILVVLVFLGKYWKAVLAKAISVQKEVGNMLTDTIYTVQDDQGWNILWVVILSYLFGMVNALGPGHGKAVTCAYLITHRSTIRSALLITSSTSLLQTFVSMLLLTLSFLLTASLSNVHPTFNFVSHVSCLCLLTFGLFLVWKGFQSKRRQESELSLYGLILALGLKPCLSTVIAMLFSSMLDLHYVGLLASLLITLGVMVTTSILACVVVMTKVAVTYGLESNSQMLSRVLQIGSGLFIAILALIMSSSTSDIAVIASLKELSSSPKITYSLTIATQQQFASL